MICAAKRKCAKHAPGGLASIHRLRMTSSKWRGLWAPQENAWLRQVSGYWNIVASFVLHGVLSEDLFLQPGFSGELFLIYSKVHPLVGELRQKLNDPEFFVSIEKVVTRTKWGKKRLQFMIKRVAMMRQRVLEQKAKS